MAQDEEVQWPAGFGIEDLVSYGSTGIVFLDESTNTVIKKPLGPEFAPHVDVERRIYERLAENGSHSGLLSFYGVFEDGIRLEYAAGFDLKSADMDGTLEMRSNWILQIAEALRFLYKNGIIYGDLTSSNIFLDANHDARVADFGGSSFDGPPLLVEEPASYCYPGSSLSIQGDIFAFDSLAYEIMNGECPCEGKDGDEVRELFSKNAFPDTRHLGPLGHIIEKCWHGQYSCSEGLLNGIRGNNIHSLQ